MTRIAILRPEPGNGATLERARALGLDAFSIPLFVAEGVEWTVPDGEFDALLLTSANTARLAGAKLAQLAHLPVHAVGSATADAARAAGLDVATVGTGGLSSLLERLDPGLRLLHLAGEDRIGVADGPAISTLTVYRSRALDTVANLEQLAGAVALVHSPRSGARLAELVDAEGIARGSIAVAAISPAAATAVGDGWKYIAAAQAPHDDALLALAAELCKMMDAS